MTAFLVSYDLVGTDVTSDNYANLIAEIEGFSNWGKIQESVWAVTAVGTPRSVFNTLWAHMHPDDRLFVTAITQWTSINHLCEDEWIVASL
jgi:hypothetical protein